MSETDWGWRRALDALAASMRELDTAREEVKALREEASEWRQRAQTAEDAWRTYDARARLREHSSGIDPKRMQDVDMEFGMTPDDAVPVPKGDGSALFIYGLIEAMLSDNRPVYLRIERRPHEPVAVVPIAEQSEGRR